MASAPCVNDKKDKNMKSRFDEAKCLMRQAKKCCIGTELLSILNVKGMYKPEFLYRLQQGTYPEKGRFTFNASILVDEWLTSIDYRNEREWPRNGGD
jgi:hypothetical protein